MNKRKKCRYPISSSGSASTNILYTLKCDVIVKISKYLEIHIKT